MAWVRTEEAAPLHPKFFRSGVAAYGFWHACLSYCNRYLTDGFIPGQDMVLVFPGTEPDVVMTLVDILVREGLLEVGTNGYHMHDYLHFQPRKKDVMKARRLRAASGRQGGLNKAKRFLQLATTQSLALAVPPTRPDPTRPDPTRPSDAGRHDNGGPPAPTQFRIPESIVAALERSPRLGRVPRLRRPDWWQAEVRANPTVDIGREVLKAESYLNAHPEKHYRKLDVFFHNWLGRADRD